MPRILRPTVRPLLDMDAHTLDSLERGLGALHALASRMNDDEDYSYNIMRQLGQLSRNVQLLTTLL